MIHWHTQPAGSEPKQSSCYNERMIRWRILERFSSRSGRGGVVLGFGDSSEDERCGAWCPYERDARGGRQRGSRLEPKI
jgi:hypothetical protein